MENSQLNKYFSNDTIFNAINKQFISLKDNDVKRVNRYLQQIVKTFIQYMKLKDSLFEKMYQHIIFCGSFYKGTKVGKPNEFDLNVILQLPLNYNYISFSSKRSAFIEIYIGDNLHAYSTQKYSNLSDQEKKLLNKLFLHNLSLKKLIYNGYLEPSKLREWIEGIITKVINELPKCLDQYKLTIINNIVCDEGHSVVYIKVKKSGPAFTLILNIPHETEDIHIDLAPALAFNVAAIQKFTSKFDLLQTCRNKVWFAIPVPLSATDCNTARNLYWRFSFFLQENEILTKHGRMKPVIRQMKKLRDVQNWKGIASYFIEMLFLNKLSELRKDLNKLPLTLLLFIMLKELHYACKQHKLKFFWDAKYNLLERIGEVQMVNIAQRINNIIKDIEKNAMIDSFILAKYILTPVEFQLLKLHLQEDNEEVTNHISNGNSFIPEKHRTLCSML